MIIDTKLNYRLNMAFVLLVISVIIGPGLAFGNVYFFHIVLVIVLFLEAIKILKAQVIEVTILKSRAIQFFGLLIVWNIFSLIWTYEIRYTLQYLFYVFIGFLIIIFINSFIKDFDNLVKALNIAIYAVIAQLLVALLEIFTDFRYPWSPYSPYSYLFGRAEFNEENYNEIALNYIAATPTGFMGNPNNLAAVLILFLPFFLFMTKKKLSFLLSGVTILVIFYTGSRGAMVTILLILILFAIFKSLKSFMKLILALPILLLVFSIFLDYASNSNSMKLREISHISDSLKSYIDFESNENEDSIGIRHILIKDGLNELKETNYIGVGGGSARKIQELKGSHITSMHNFWIEMLVENGVLIFALFALWYFAIVVKLFRIFKTQTVREQKNLAGAFLFSLVGFIPGAISASSTIYLLPMWLMFGFAVLFIRLEGRKNQ